MDKISFSLLNCSISCCKLSLFPTQTESNKQIPNIRVEKDKNDFVRAKGFADIRVRTNNPEDDYLRPITYISDEELVEAKNRAAKNHVEIHFEHADFCALSETFSGQFDIIINMDNALPHMLSADALESAVKSITNQLTDGGIFGR